MDNLVTSLSKYTVLLAPGAAKPAVEFGNSEKASIACETAFQLANRCAQRYPWRYLLPCPSRSPSIIYGIAFQINCLRDLPP